MKRMILILLVICALISTAVAQRQPFKFKISEQATLDSDLKSGLEVVFEDPDALVEYFEIALIEDDKEYQARVGPYLRSKKIIRPKEGTQVTVLDRYELELPSRTKPGKFPRNIYRIEITSGEYAGYVGHVVEPSLKPLVESPMTGDLQRLLKSL